jgi:uroporphyrinogen-III decarboxylase
LGSAVPKLSLSFARLNYNLETTKENITEGVDLWFEMFKNAKKMASTQFSPNDLYKLNVNARMLYITLNDAFGLDVKINKEDIKKNTKLSEWDLDQALQELQIKGALYCPGNQCYVLLDFR